MIIANVFTDFLKDFAVSGRMLGIKIIGSVLIIVIGWVIVGIIKRVITKPVEQTKFDPSFKRFLIKTVDIVLKVLIVLCAISNLGISTTGLIAALSAAAVAISLALKDSLGNIAGGILMMITRPFSTGDFISVDGESGTVVNIDLIHTTLLTVDNRHVVVPNGQMVNKTITDYSREDTRRVDIDFKISYDSDVEKAKALIIGLANSCEFTLSEPAPFARVTDYGDSSVTVTARIWCKSENFWDLKLYMLENTMVEFRENGVSIPFNQLDVHIDGKLSK